MKIIALDLDDVIADSTEALRLIVNQRINAQLTAEDYKTTGGDYRGYYDRVWMRHGVADKVKYADLLDEMEGDQSHVPVLPGAAFALGELSKRFKLVIITARNQDWEKATKAWLAQQFGDTFDTIHFAHGKDPDSKTKGQLCREVGASWLIDDNPVHCVSAQEVGVTPLLFGQYGWHQDVPANVVNCKDWPAVLEYFDGRG
jgi:FMN phosphatase YigB (HAD superfamily)